MAPRDISAQEVAIVEWLLDHAAMGDVAAYRSKPLTASKVVGGCASLDFQNKTSGCDIIADWGAFYSDRQRAGIILWGRGHELVMLKVYEIDPVADGVPEIADLRRFDVLR